MLHSYRVTKYIHKTPSGYLFSADDEWTSFSDVGTLVTMKEYLKVENSYLEIFSSACSHFNINNLIITDLTSPRLSKNLVEEQSLDVKESVNLVRNILREELWCKLSSAEIKFHFGYDYYMYLISKTDIFDLLLSIKTQKKLHIEKHPSPYL